MNVTKRTKDSSNILVFRYQHKNYMLSPLCKNVSLIVYLFVIVRTNRLSFQPITGEMLI